MKDRVQRLLTLIRERHTDLALAYKGQSYSYSDLESAHRAWLGNIERVGIQEGEVVALKADYSPACISLFLALLSKRYVIALLPPSATSDCTYLNESHANWLISFHGDQPGEWNAIETQTSHPLLKQLRSEHRSGIILFSSGTSGRPKTILHDSDRFLSKFDSATKRLSTLTFLLFDHIAGLDTLFYGLASGSLLVFPERRDPAYICSLIEKHRIEVLPTSPSFLRLFCISGANESYDLSSLRIITYGSEPMDSATLKRVQNLLPGVKLIQKYGMTELGSPRSKTRDDGSLWMKIGDEQLSYKILDGILWVKSRSAMLGYLNAPNPFDNEGWFCTGDAVEVDGDWIHILGRKSEMIIVGGEKVYPQEVEAIILEMEDVCSVVVRGQPHPLMGQVVTAEIEFTGSIERKELQKQVRKHCRKTLSPYKVPITVTIAESALTTDRIKLNRTPRTA